MGLSDEHAEKFIGAYDIFMCELPVSLVDRVAYGLLMGSTSLDRYIKGSQGGLTVVTVPACQGLDRVRERGCCTHVENVRVVPLVFIFCAAPNRSTTSIS